MSDTRRSLISSNSWCLGRHKVLHYGHEVLSVIFWNGALGVHQPLPRCLMYYRSVACFQWTLRACLCPVSASDKKMSGPFSGPFPPKVWLGRIAFSCFKQHSGHDWDWVEVTQTARGSAPQGWWVHMIWTGLLYQSRLHDESINVISSAFLVVCIHYMRGVHIDNIKCFWLAPWPWTLYKKHFPPTLAFFLL